MLDADVFPPQLLIFVLIRIAQSATPPEMSFMEKLRSFSAQRTRLKRRNVFDDLLPFRRNDAGGCSQQI